MNKRTAKYIALRALIDDANAQLGNGADVWNTRPDSKEDLTDEESQKVEDEARLILDALEKRAEKLKP